MGTNDGIFSGGEADGGGGYIGMDMSFFSCGILVLRSCWPRFLNNCRSWAIDDVYLLLVFGMDKQNIRAVLAEHGCTHN